MKVLHVNNILDPVRGGGTAERIMQVSRFLSMRGVDCTILTLDVGVPESMRARAGAVRIATLPGLIERYFVPSLSRDTLSVLVSSADVIHMMNHWTILNALVFLYARRYGKPYAVCPAGALPLFGRSKFIKKIYNLVIGKKIVRQAASCIAISPREVEDFKRYGAEAERISVIPNGIDPEGLTRRDDRGFRKKYGLPDISIPILLFLGRLNPIKGPDLLLEAFIRAVRKERFPHHLVFAGPDGGMLRELKARSTSEGLMARVHFPGHVGGEDKSHALHAADMLVIPSRQEAMSIVVLEAGITGTPVLITDQCGFNEVEAAGGGRVVAATAEALQQGLTSMLGDRDRLRRMGQKLETYVRANFLWERMVDRYIELFEAMNKKIADRSFRRISDCGRG
jgi:glycosyltransferase involved in cell wall biosynthesis